MLHCGEGRVKRHLDHPDRLRCRTDCAHAFAGSERPQGFILTTVLGVAGAFIATFIGQTVGWYRLDQGAGLIGATIGALVVLFVWNRLVAHHIISDPGDPGASAPRR